MKILTFGYITPHIEACPHCNAMLQVTDADLGDWGSDHSYLIKCPVCGTGFTPQYKIDEKRRKENEKVYQNRDRDDREHRIRSADPLYMDMDI